MRYQRVSPDSLPHVNGRKSTTSDDDASSGGIAVSRSPFKTQEPLSLGGGSPQSENHQSPSRKGGGGDVLLQWGQKKRSRIPRSEIRPSVQTQPINKVRRRAPGLVAADEHSGAAVPPPVPLTRAGKESRGNGILPVRNLEEQSVAGNGSASRNGLGVSSSRSTAGKRSLPFFSSIDKSNGSLQNHNHMNGKRQSSAAKVKESAPPPAKVLECPRIYLSLSKKEKEDDFVAMKGTKLPHRPKKRPKNVDKSLQYCYPGMWLSELTRSRYEVREKKSVNKQQKRRGLKGMESLDSDSQ